MNREPLLYGIIGLLLGVVLTLGVTGYQQEDPMEGMMRSIDMHSQTQDADGMGDDGMGMSMGDMNAALEGKTGDEFDKAFIEMMIEHHQGAIDMANLIPERAKHQEIKNLGKAIIAAQTKEINDMKAWAKAWGYGLEGNMMMQGGSMMQNMQH